MTKIVRLPDEPQQELPLDKEIAEFISEPLPEETMKLEDGKIYMIMSKNGDENIIFEVYDRLDTSEDSAVISTICRGMIELASTDPEKALELGAKGFARSYQERTGWSTDGIVGNA